MRKTISALSIVLLLALLAITMASSVAADPTPQTINDVQLVELATGARGYDSDFRVRAFSGWYGVTDLYLTAALSETDQLVMTVQHSPDGTNAWVDTSSVYIFTAATAPAFQHVQVANYGQSLAVYMDISGTVRYTPTIYAVMKNNAGR